VLDIAEEIETGKVYVRSGYLICESQMPPGMQLRKGESPYSGWRFCAKEQLWLTPMNADALPLLQRCPFCKSLLRASPLKSKAIKKRI
jgi:hypothetical protein